MKLLLCYGTRPEYIKIKPLMTELNRGGIRFNTFYTGQHPDLVIQDQKAHYQTEIQTWSPNRLNNIGLNLLRDHSFLQEFSEVLVQGDTASAFFIALNCFHQRIKVIHLEAGLRTYCENPYPEEFYRQAISKMACIHLCPTEGNRLNLINEKVQGQIFVVGNTVLDNLLGIKTSCDPIVVITLHRRENHPLIAEWFTALARLSISERASHLRFIIPLHPSPNVQKYRHLLETDSRIEVIEPLPYNDMIQLVARASLVITDSGGLQEETCFLKKKVIVCREVTERPECLGLNGILCPRPAMLSDVFEGLESFSINKDYKCPFGDGNASGQIAELFSTHIHSL